MNFKKIKAFLTLFTLILPLEIKADDYQFLKSQSSSNSISIYGVKSSGTSALLNTYTSTSPNTDAMMSNFGGGLVDQYQGKIYFFVSEVEYDYETAEIPIPINEESYYLSYDLINNEFKNTFKNKTYLDQNLSSGLKYLKDILNYYIKDEYKDSVIDDLMLKFCNNEKLIKEKFYLSKNDIRKMENCGMLIGSHSVTHPVMSKLSEEEQESEIKNSFNEIEGILEQKTIRTFCYPYGGFHSFNSTTEKLLNKYSVMFSFNVESRNIENEDLQNKNQKLPRYDCNAFPFGKIFNWSKHLHD